ncbi:hypothetical protein EDEG_00369 [Edhazardia aedis USNM 41457]|uniref:Superoxide dismutase n=1 Tax=Edhazardia aedis (strain USNM 41457) TaxID=1003232 RepID=J8ZQ09_EDHAE|nr:hypothetical protein EDEG_00369 [Edhazardia aedis USNM 41457]|eukprot:EJW01778.1 hypothetical protein EDEG_00369 [Edhazardia aedis USNM 41457]
MFSLPNLRYANDSLDIFVDKKTMEIHRERHHQTYINNLNKEINDKKIFLDFSLVEILKNLKDDSSHQKIRNNTGGHYNHSLFWYNINPISEISDLGQNLKNKINESFGSFENFKDLFSTTALNIFGSGWAWLCYDPISKTLRIIQTSNQDNPISNSNLIPILTLDVWEHAYYLKYQNLRKDYIENFWFVVDWKNVNYFYENYAINNLSIDIKEDGTINLTNNKQ